MQGSLEMAKKTDGGPGNSVPPGKPQRRTQAVQIEKELARMVAVIASHRGISQSEFLSDYIRQYVTTNYRQVRTAMGKELDELTDEAE